MVVVSVLMLLGMAPIVVVLGMPTLLAIVGVAPLVVADVVVVVVSVALLLATAMRLIHWDRCCICRELVR
jgi:hypothetical protein